MNNVPSVVQLKDMLHDTMGPNFFNNENSATGVEDAAQFDARFGDPYGVSTESIFKEPRGDAKEFFDLFTHPEFASEPRNVRLGLCTDGFTPFGHSASPYSCWPAFVSVYNMPPAMCMKQEYVFFSLIIQGPQSLGKNIDVMLRPLIDDLKQLWWSTHGKLACPYCMENSKAFWLENGWKTSFLDCHRQFLPSEHPFKRNKNDFIKGRTENGTMSERLSGDEMHSCIHWPHDVLFGKPPQK
ncbi:hypothetical protein SLEP1_g16678 [Rubroshorea leprosula]|uniref:Uncharacterized protein n=1 Tax=Rubroshorea leprosula TaxID=152421 RepID=A0AAV5IVH3_9ROSI|nr:hypothetical protein SLEP1_g16678 [Rubroshorea leprosula]